MSQAFGRAYSSAAPGETGYASLRGKQLDFLNAEDFRCHAIRGRAIQTFSRTHSAVATSSAFTRAQSDITDIRRHHDEMRSLSPERADDPCASLETVLEPVFEADEPIARPYLAWACSQLGVPDKYTSSTGGCDRERTAQANRAQMKRRRSTRWIRWCSTSR